MKPDNTLNYLGLIGYIMMVYIYMFNPEGPNYVYVGFWGICILITLYLIWESHKEQR